MTNNTESNFVCQSFKEEYKCVSTSLINRSFEWKDRQINILLESAMLELGELNAYSRIFPEIGRYEPMFVAQEAVASNLMEGNKSAIFQAFILDVIQSNKGGYVQKELANHIKAINWGVAELEKFPLSIRLIKESHKILYSGLPDKTEYGGKLRPSFRAYDSPFENRLNYTPPNKQELKILINDGKKFWRNDDLELPQLIKMAISLYQFENILPFLDGNGKTARTLILFELLSLKFVSRPVFSLSVFFEKNRLEYYQRLNLARSRNDIEQWIRFFLTGIGETAKHSKKILNKILDLSEHYNQVIEARLGKKRQQSAKQLLKLLYIKPFLSVNQIKEKLQLSFQASNQLVKEFEAIGIIKEYAGVRRNRIFYLSGYVGLFEL